MWPKRHSSEDREGPISARLLLARLESVVDRLEGVYERMAPNVEQAKTLPVSPPPKKNGHGNG